jgi:anion-transporting  ArsA/GET3 family ATPase
VLVVTIPEELPTTEAIQLVDRLRQELALPMEALVVNAVVPPLFSDAEREAFEQMDQGNDLPARGALRAAACRAAEERLQAQSLARLRSETGLQPIELTYLFEEVATPKAIRKLAQSF